MAEYPELKMSNKDFFDDFMNFKNDWQEDNIPKGHINENTSCFQAGSHQKRPFLLQSKKVTAPRHQKELDVDNIKKKSTLKIVEVGKLT